MKRGQSRHDRKSLCRSLLPRESCVRENSSARREEAHDD